jgi:hypothetical protein
VSADRKLSEDLNSLISPPKEKALRDIAPREGFPEGVGTATPEPVATGGGGISSPLTEPSFAARQYYAANPVTSSDGIFTIELLPIKKLVMQDAEAQEVVFDFADPEA